MNQETCKLHPSNGHCALAALLFVGAVFVGCDVDQDLSHEAQALALDDEALDDESFDDEALDALVAPGEPAEHAAPDEPQTVRDLLTLLPPHLVPDDLTPEELDRAVEVGPLQIAIDVDGNGVIDDIDDFKAATGPMVIGEAACATASIANPNDGATVPMTPTPSCSVQWDGSTSPNTSYNPQGCPHQYITDVTGTFGRALTFYPKWGGNTLDQAGCEISQIKLSAYGMTFNFFTGQSSWVKFGTTTYHGKWVPGPVSMCDFLVAPGETPLPSLPAGHPYARVRTAAQAATIVWKQRVESGVQHGPGPC